jgi:hypothetical protein
MRRSPSAQYKSIVATGVLGRVPGFNSSAPRASDSIERPPQTTSSRFLLRVRQAQGSLGLLIARYESKPGTPPSRNGG